MPSFRSISSMNERIARVRGESRCARSNRIPSMITRRFYHRGYFRLRCDGIHMSSPLLAGEIHKSWYHERMASLNRQKARFSMFIKRSSLVMVMGLGFLSILFARDFPGFGKVANAPKGSGVAYADAPACSGDSGGCAGSGDSGCGCGAGGGTGGGGGSE